MPCVDWAWAPSAPMGSGWAKLVGSHNFVLKRHRFCAPLECVPTGVCWDIRSCSAAYGKDSSTGDKTENQYLAMHGGHKRKRPLEASAQAATPLLSTKKGANHSHDHLLAARETRRDVRVEILNSANLSNRPKTQSLTSHVRIFFELSVLAASSAAERPSAHS